MLQITKLVWRTTAQFTFALSDSFAEVKAPRIVWAADNSFSSTRLAPQEAKCCRAVLMVSDLSTPFSPLKQDIFYPFMSYESPKHAIFTENGWFRSNLGVYVIKNQIQYLFDTEVFIQLATVKFVSQVHSYINDSHT
jgi:hypothetical protein